jgi:ribosomal protein L6P/L9E
MFKNIRNTIALKFGFSHLYYSYFFFLSIKVLSKKSIFLFGINYSDLYFKSHKLSSIKSINIFTGRGIRFSRQIIYKKTGKVSSYR